jgi:hypothetical protein
VVTPVLGRAALASGRRQLSGRTHGPQLRRLTGALRRYGRAPDRRSRCRSRPARHGRGHQQEPAPELQANLDDDSAEAEFEKLLYKPGAARIFKPRTAAHAVSTVQQYLHAIREFTLADRIDRITCPTLIFDSEGDRVATGPGKQVYDGLRCEKEFYLFTDEHGAGGHGHPLAQLLFFQLAFDFLDRRLAVSEATTGPRSRPNQQPLAGESRRRASPSVMARQISALASPA